MDIALRCSECNVRHAMHLSPNRHSTHLTMDAALRLPYKQIQWKIYFILSNLFITMVKKTRKMFTKSTLKC